MIDGLTTLDEFTERTGLVLPEGPYDTWPATSWPSSVGCPAWAMSPRSRSAPVRNPSEGTARLELQVSELDGRRASAFVLRRLDSGQPSLKEH